MLALAQSDQASNVSQIQELQRILASKDSVIRNLHEIAADYQERLAKIRNCLLESGVYPREDGRPDDDADLQCLGALIRERDSLRASVNTARTLQAVPRPEGCATAFARTAYIEEDLLKCQSDLASARFRIMELEATQCAGSRLDVSRSQTDVMVVLEEQTLALRGELEVQVRLALLKKVNTVRTLEYIARSAVVNRLQTAMGVWIAFTAGCVDMRHKGWVAKSYPHPFAADTRAVWLQGVVEAIELAFELLACRCSSWLVRYVWTSWSSYLLHEKSLKRDISMSLTAISHRSMHAGIVLIQQVWFRWRDWTSMAAASTIVQIGRDQNIYKLFVRAWLAWRRCLQQPMLSFIPMLRCTRILILAWLAWRKIWTTSILQTWQTAAFADPQTLVIVVYVWMGWCAQVQDRTLFTHLEKVQQEFVQHFFDSAAFRYITNLLKSVWVAWKYRCTLRALITSTQTANVALQEVNLTLVVWRLWHGLLVESKAADRMRVAFGHLSSKACAFHAWRNSVWEYYASQHMREGGRLECAARDIISRKLSLCLAPGTSHTFVARQCHRSTSKAIFIGRMSIAYNHSMLMKDALQCWHYVVAMSHAYCSHALALQVHLAGVEAYVRNVERQQDSALLRYVVLHWCCQSWVERLLLGQVFTAWHVVGIRASSRQTETALKVAHVGAVVEVEACTRIMCLGFRLWTVWRVYAADLRSRVVYLDRMKAFLALLSPRDCDMLSEVLLVWCSHVTSAQEIKKMIAKSCRASNAVAIMRTLDVVKVREIEQLGLAWVAWYRAVSNARTDRGGGSASRSTFVPRVSAVLSFVWARNPHHIAEVFLGWQATACILRASYKEAMTQLVCLTFSLDLKLLQSMWMLWCHRLLLSQDVAKRVGHSSMLGTMLEVHHQQLCLEQIASIWIAWAAAANGSSRIRTIDGLSIAVARSHGKLVERCWACWELQISQTRLCFARRDAASLRRDHRNASSLVSIIHAWSCCVSVRHFTDALTVIVTMTGKRKHNSILRCTLALWYLVVHLLQASSILSKVQSGGAAVINACHSRNTATLFVRAWEAWREKSRFSAHLAGRLDMTLSWEILLKCFSSWAGACGQGSQMRQEHATTLQTQLTDQLTRLREIGELQKVVHQTFVVWRWSALKEKTMRVAFEKCLSHGRIRVVDLVDLQRCLNAWAWRTTARIVTKSVSQLKLSHSQHLKRSSAIAEYVGSQHVGLLFIIARECFSIWFDRTNKNKVLQWDIGVRAEVRLECVREHLSRTLSCFTTNMTASRDMSALIQGCLLSWSVLTSCGRAYRHCKQFLQEYVLHSSVFYRHTFLHKCFLLWELSMYRRKTVRYHGAYVERWQLLPGSLLRKCLHGWLETSLRQQARLGTKVFQWLQACLHSWMVVCWRQARARNKT